jgi:hypothetical protein
MRLELSDLTVTSYETTAEDAQAFAVVACTTTLDSLVEAICPDGLTVGCHDTTVVY